ncbi:MAG: hypothetical protein M3Q87_05780, partial [Actinomycetota bacterium]|nr:hypothetical protein [Actinomycetota bacterium]
MTERVYLHIGPPKTATSHVQQALCAGKQALATTGVLIPGESHNAHRLATWDFFGRRPEGADMRAATGSWRVLVDQVRAWDGTTAVISEESLAAARKPQVRRLVRAFAPADVHVVVTARDLDRVIPAAWQQRVQGGETQQWSDFLSELRDPRRASPPALLFWRRQDLVQVLSAWERAVPAGRIHVVTVPPAGSPPRLLLERFAEATGLDPDVLQAAGDGGPAATNPALNNPAPAMAALNNPALGMVEAEALRRLNAGLGGRLDERQYRRVVTTAVLPALRSRPHQTRIVLPPEHRAWVRERSRAVVGELRAGAYNVSGDLDDLLGASDEQQRADDSPELSDADLA